MKGLDFSSKRSAITPGTRGDIFVVRWLNALPHRWARNGAIFGAIFSYAQLGRSKDIEQLFQDSRRLLSISVAFVVITVGAALLFFLLGLWARRALLHGPQREWALVAKSIPRKWALGAALLGLLMILADAVFEWRGEVLRPGGSVAAAVGNVGYVIGLLATSSITGFMAGLISRRALRRAIFDDQLSASSWKPVGGISSLSAPARLLNAGDPEDQSAAPRLIAGRDGIAPADLGSGTGRVLVIAGLMTVVLAISAGLTVYSSWKPRDAISPEVVGRLDPKGQLAARRLVGEPCNRTLEDELVTSLLERAEYGAIVAFSEQTTAKCGSNEELLAAVVTAQLRSSDFVAAERTADQLAAEYPADPNVFGWRAEAREKRGKFAGAYADMRTALSLFLDPSDVALSVYYDLARLAAKAGHPCEAVVTLRDYIAFDPEKRRTQQLTTLMRGWQNQGSCAPYRAQEAPSYALIQMRLLSSCRSP